MEKLIEVFGQEGERWRVLPIDIFLFVLLFLAVSGCEILEGRKVKEYQTILRQPIHSEAKQFENEKLRINFSPSHEVISFVLQNKTQSPIKIIWDEIIFTNPEGKTYRVLNPSMKYKRPGKITDTADRHIAPTEVAPGQTYTDYIRPLPAGVEDELIYPFKDAQGSRFKLTLPLEIEGQVNVYTFAFEVIEAPVKVHAPY